MERTADAQPHRTLLGVRIQLSSSNRMEPSRLLLYENGASLGIFPPALGGDDHEVTLPSVIVMEPEGACFTHIHQVSTLCIPVFVLFTMGAMYSYVELVSVQMFYFEGKRRFVVVLTYREMFCASDILSASEARATLIFLSHEIFVLQTNSFTDINSTSIVHRDIKYSSLRNYEQLRRRSPLDFYFRFHAERRDGRQGAGARFHFYKLQA